MSQEAIARWVRDHVALCEAARHNHDFPCRLETMISDGRFRPIKSVFDIQNKYISWNLPHLPHISEEVLTAPPLQSPVIVVLFTATNTQRSIATTAST